MSSTPFERQIIESGSSDNHRSNSSTRAADGPQQFSPSPSFVDHDRPTARLVELPAWLQSFAASVGEPASELSRSDTAVELQKSALSGDESSSPAVERVDDDRSAGGGGFSTSFISEDDLPEWLRSIAPADSGDAESDFFQFRDPSDKGPLTVPSVTRAWSTAGDARTIDEPTSLFALLASQAPQNALAANAVGGTDVPGARAAAEGTSSERGAVASYGSSVPPGFEPSRSLADPSADQPVSEQTASSAFPVLPVVVAGVLLLVLLLAAAVLFLS